MPVINVNSIFSGRKAHRPEVLPRANLGKVGWSLKMPKLGIAPAFGTLEFL